MNMSSVIFQPLLHDPLGWKPSNSTYADHYKWRKCRSTSTDKKSSIYAQQYQRRLRKQQYQQQKQANQCVPVTLNGEQKINTAIFLKKAEDNQEQLVSRRSSPSKTPVYVIEDKQQLATADENIKYYSRSSQRSQTILPTFEEKPRSLTTVEIHHPSKEEKEKEKEKTPVDPNNDNSRHWLTYPNPRTPQYIIDIKQRLGQLKVPSTLSRPSSASTSSLQQQSQQDQQQNTPQPIIRPLSASTQMQQKQQTNNDQRHFLTFPTRETPDDLRAIRYRLDKHRYNPSLDNYPPRPKTCPVRTTDTSNPITPQEFQNEPSLPPPPKNDVWIVEEDQTPVVPDYESSSILIQMVDCDGLPNEYADALETANAAQEEYQRKLKMNVDRKPHNLVSRLSTTLPDNKSESLTGYQNQQSSTEMNHQLRQIVRTSQNDFGTWVRQATDKERASAMKILQEVLNQPIMSYDTQTKRKTPLKQAPAPSPVRTTSATRKLGRTRTQHQFPCEICEKLLIKRHVWDLSGRESLTCSHHPQDIQVRA